MFKNKTKIAVLKIESKKLCDSTIYILRTIRELEGVPLENKNWAIKFAKETDYLLRS